MIKVKQREDLRNEKTARDPGCLRHGHGLTACASTPKEDTPTPTPEESTAPVVESFSAEYEMDGTTSAGKPKNDTFIFEGKTTDGIITELNFDIIRNKGLEGEYSKKDIMGYQMNVSDAAVTKTGDGFELTNLGMNGYETKFGQYMTPPSARI